MSTTKATESAAVRREAWGSLRKLPSGRWQARYPAPGGETYTARTEDDKPLTFLTTTDARTWLAAVHTKIARREWEPPSVLAARRRAEAAAERARSIGFSELDQAWEYSGDPGARNDDWRPESDWDGNLSWVYDGLVMKSPDQVWSYYVTAGGPELESDVEQFEAAYTSECATD